MSGVKNSQSVERRSVGNVGPMEQPPAYDVRSVRFRYRSREVSASGWALEDVSFQIHESEVVGIVGPNGSGKTSLLKVLAGLAQPEQGSIELLGRDLSGMSPEELARVVGVVPQDTQQLFPFTVAETVLMGRFPHHVRARWGSGFGWESAEDMAIAEEAMMTMDIVHLAHRAVTELSGGERQRAVIARALAQTPKILLLDEPTAFLDLHHQVEIGSALRRLNDDHGLTVILISHDLNLVAQYCDRILLLDRGHVVRLGSPEDVMEPVLLERVYRCRVLVDRHPESGVPRVTLPGREPMGNG